MKTNGEDVKSREGEDVLEEIELSEESTSREKTTKYQR